MCHHMLRLRGVFMVYGFGEKNLWFMVLGEIFHGLWFPTPPQNPPLIHDIPIFCIYNFSVPINCIYKKSDPTF